MPNREETIASHQKEIDRLLLQIDTARTRLSELLSSGENDDVIAMHKQLIANDFREIHKREELIERENDKELMAEIKAQADKAEEARPETIDVSVLAMTLGAKFPHRSVDEIRQKIIDAWRANDLFYTE